MGEKRWRPTFSWLVLLLLTNWQWRPTVDDVMTNNSRDRCLNSCSPSHSHLQTTTSSPDCDCCYCIPIYSTPLIVIAFLSVVMVANKSYGMAVTENLMLYTTFFHCFIPLNHCFLPSWFSFSHFSFCILLPVFSSRTQQQRTQDHLWNIFFYSKFPYLHIDFNYEFTDFPYTNTCFWRLL